MELWTAILSATAVIVAALIGLIGQMVANRRKVEGLINEIKHLGQQQIGVKDGDPCLAKQHENMQYNFKDMMENVLLPSEKKINDILPTGSNSRIISKSKSL